MCNARVLGALVIHGGLWKVSYLNLHAIDSLLVCGLFTEDRICCAHVGIKTITLLSVTHIFTHPYSLKCVCDQ